jgi:putative PIN family toxin of toxin-antitoxin system
MGARAKKLTPRVVLDTNVVLSALIFSRGRFAWLREAWQSGRIRPLVCRATAEELIAVLAYPKFRLDPAERDELLADYLPWCETVVLPDPPPAVPECRDPGDHPFLWLAVAADADCLVTGDGDLQALSGGFDPPILTVEALRRLDAPHAAGEE